MLGKKKCSVCGVCECECQEEGAGDIINTQMIVDFPRPAPPSRKTRCSSSSSMLPLAGLSGGPLACAACVFCVCEHRCPPHRMDQRAKGWKRGCQDLRLGHIPFSMPGKGVESALAPGLRHILDPTRPRSILCVCPLWSSAPGHCGASRRGQQQHLISALER